MRNERKSASNGASFPSALDGPASLLALEPRMMFDGAAVDTAVETLLPNIDAELLVQHGIAMRDALFLGRDFGGGGMELHAFRQMDVDIRGAGFAQDTDTHTDTGAPDILADMGTGAPGELPNEVIFIDTSIAGYETLVSEWQGRGTIVLIDSSIDGIEQVMTALAGRSNLNAIHFVSHGSQNSFNLGSTVVGIDSITGSLASSWALIGSRLSADGDILLYGCNISLDDTGQSFVDAMALATGADVAASTDVTGDAAQGGNWTLEAHNGSIEATTLVSARYAGLLQQINSGSWAVTGNTGTQTIDGVGVTIALTSGTAGWSGTANDTFNPALPAGTWGTNIAGTPSLITVFNGTNVANGTATITITFSQAVTNPILNIDRLGGLNTGVVGSQTTNSALLTVTTPGATLTNLGNLSHFAVTGTTITRTTGVISTGTESSTSSATGTAAGSVRINGTYTSITFVVSASNGDGFEIGVTIDAPPDARDDAFRINENATLTGNLFANNGSGVDSDIRGDALTISRVNGAAFTVGTPIQLTNGVLTITNAATGAFTFQPRANFYGTQTFTYDASDPNGGFDTATVTITVNDTPLVDLNSGTTSSQMITNGGAPGTAGWTVAGTGNIANGGWSWNTDNATGSVTQTGLTGWASGSGPSGAAQLSFNYGWNNGVPDAATAATVNVSVGGVIYATITTGTPGAAAGTATITYLNGATGSPATVASSTFNAWTATNVTINLPTTVANTGDLVFSYSATGGANDDMWIDAVSAITVTDAVAGNNFTNTFTEGGPAVSIAALGNTVRDGNDTNMESASITLTNPQTGDQLLVNGSAAASGTLTGGISYTIVGNTVTLTGSATSANYAAAIRAIQFNNTSHTPSVTPRTINVTVNDGDLNSNTAVATINVIPVNDAPTAVGTLPAQLNLDASTVTSVATAGGFIDVDGPALTYSATGLPAGLTINASTGVISGTIDRSASQTGGGVYNVVVTASDGSLSTTQSFSWTVTNPAPTATNDTASTNEDTPVLIPVLTNDTDPDGDPLTITVATASVGTATIVGGQIQYTPPANFNGTATINYTISDGQGGTSNATVTVTVNAVNDGPTTVGTLPPQSNVDAASGISVATAGGFTDVDGPTAIYSATGLPAGLTINASTGVISGTINRSASQTGGGVYNVVVTRSDGSLSASQSFSWTITNPAPTAVNDPTLTVNEDTAGTTVNVLANDTDPDGDPLTITSASAVNGTVVVNGNGTITYTPNANFNGTDTITYSISDGQGGTSTATIPVTVTAVNDAPTAVGSLAPRNNVDAATGINVATAGAFTDIDNASLSYSATGLPAGLSINAVTGAITGTISPSASQGGTGGVYSVTVTATDAGGLTATQTFSWTVTNPAPIAVNNIASTNEDTVIPSINVLGNDSDPDGDTLTVVSASAANGTVTINPDGTLRYTPNANFNGTDTITYSISDGQGGTATATVTVTVIAVNDAPTPVGTLPPQSNVDAATGVNVATAAAFTDVDNATLSYSASGLPAGLSINATTGAITGTINRSASQGGAGGVYSVTVTATDAGGLSATQVFSWTVTNPAPTATNDSATTAEDTPVLISVLPNDSDPDGDPLTIIAATASVGTATIVGNQVRYTPPANYNGTATISYTISDGEGGTSTATITVTVTPVNDAPVGTAIPARNTNDGATIAVSVAGNFSDVDGNALTFAATGLPPGLSINPATGMISGTLTANASQTNGGVYTATITVSDGNGGTTSQTITFNVSNPPPVAANDTAATPEDTPVTVNVLANDSDPDGDPLTVTAATALNGTVVINANGTITYTPNPGYHGSDTISYTISDGNGGTTTATVAVSVADVNDAPVTSGTIASQTNADAQVVSLPVASAFTDPDGDTLTYSATGLPAGLTINATTGVISGTIDNSASQANGGAYSITVTANDGRGGTVSQTFSWTVTNPGPTAANDSATTNEDTPVNIAVLANDVDPDGDLLTVTSASAGNGTVTINANGTLVYTPNANFNGTDTIVYTITDSEGGVATASVTVTVNPVNDTPTTVGLPNQNGDDGQTVSFSVASAFGDPDGDPLTFSATGLPPTLTINPVTGLITGTLAPESSQNGPYVVTVTATDPSGAQVTTSFVYSVQNVPPVAVNDVATTPEDVPVTVAVLTNDSDPDNDPLTITSASANNGTVVINANGTLTFTPNPNFNGIANISYTVSDGNGGIATATLTVTVAAVNDAPTADTIPNLTNQDGEATAVNVGSFFHDLDGDTLSFSATGLPPGIGIDPATGILSGTIAANASQSGPYSVTITANDGHGGTVSQTFTWGVGNPAPVAANDTATTNEDTSVTIAVLANDVDPDGDPLIVTSATALNGTVVINANGTISYTPNANYNGSDTITYTISDGNGGTSTATVAVTIDPVNDAPVAVNDSATTNEDTPLTLNPLSNDSDVDGDPLTITAATSPDGIVTINPDGTITFTPATNFNGPTTISYTISDGNGGTATATIAVNVVSVNDAPVANPSTANTAEDTPVVVPVLANDTDVDGDPLTVTSATAPNGTVVINANGTVTYTPNPNFNGTDTITYSISDGHGGFSTSTVTITVGATNDAPVATPIAPRTNNDSDAVSLSVAGNFSDPDGDTLSYSATGLPAGLSINPVTGVISGTIAANASQPAGGVYSVTVTASDGNGATVSTTFNWTVENPVPIATNDTAITNEDTAVIVSVLANDSDPDGDPLTVTSATAPNGTVVINANGTITYTPALNFNGTDTITYTISDGNGGTATATVTVTVNPANDAPVVDAPLANVSGVDSGTVSIPTAGNFSDVDGDTLSFAATGLPAGLSINPATGVISGTIAANASQPNGGVYSVTVTASDGHGGTVSSTFTYTVTNPGPTANNDTATTNEDAPVTVAVLANDTDPDGDSLTVTSASSPNGTVVVNPNGTITFTPAANFNGPTTITYAISDGNGGTSTATVNITVNPVNDAPVVDTPIANQTTPDSTTVTLPVAGNFSDLDGDTLSFSATGLPAGLSINPTTGVISGTIAANASQPNGGIYTITVTASDGNGGTVSTSFGWTVTNPAPVAGNDAATTNEDTPVTVSVLANDSDPDGDPLTVTSATASNGIVVINANGSITYTPNANFNGTDTITYAISDGNGGTTTATVTITVTPVNDAPVVATPLPGQSDSDSAVVSVATAANFTDIDGNTLTYSATGLPAGLTINTSTGVISGTIDPAASQLNGGNYTVTVTANDGNGGTVAATFNWAVTNPAPTATNDTATTNEDTPVNVTVLANDNDPDGDPLTVTAASAVNGTVVINANGSITYTPNANFNGADTITYSISDGNGGTATATVTVTVNANNDAPSTVGLPDQFDINSDVVSVPVGPAFSDLDGDTLTYSATGLPLGLSINPATGEISGIVDSNASAVGGGIYAITVTANDGNGGTVSTNFTWTITNTAPNAVDDTGTTNEDTAVTLDVLANDNDPNSNPLTVVSATATHGTVVINPDGTLTFTPATNFNGTATVSYQISDGIGGFSTATATITVAPVNDAPTAGTLPNQSNLDSDTVNVAAGSYFSDLDGDTLAFSATGLPAGLSINSATGAITGTIDPSASQAPGGLYTVTVTADDGNGGITSTTLIWRVTNPAPIAGNDTASTSEDVPVTVAILANDSDPDGDPLTVLSASAPNGTVVINVNGSITYTPNANFNGTDTVTYTISDGNGGTATATVTVTVGATNDAPVATPLPARSTPDSSVVSLPVAGNFSDLDGDTLSFTATGLPTGLSIDPVTGVISGTISSGASQGGVGGVYSVTVTADDGNGGVVSTTFNWTVTNPTPVATNDIATTNEDTPVTIAVLANDSDPDGDLLTVTTATSPDGTVVINPDGSLTFTPNANFNGAASITYTISDGNGGTATATVAVSVTAVNDAPVASPIGARSNVDSAVVSVPVAGNFTDVDADTLTYTATGLPAGLTIDSVTGIISGTIAPNASTGGVGGVYTVIITANDGAGGITPTTFNWTVTNPAPVAVADTAATAEDTLVNINVLTNDSDPDGDTISVATAVAGNGTVTILPNGTINYLPNANFNGVDTITYTISDGNGGFATSTVTITVTAVNDAPVALNDATSTDEDTPVTLAPLGNDSDLDGDPLTITSATAPNGTVVINPDGTVTYTPNANFNGTDTITYTISDGNGGTDTATITVIVASINDAPVANNDSATTNEDTPITINPLGNDTDADGDPLTVTSATSPNGQVVINPDGTITFTPNANFSGTTTVTYTISDGNGGTATATITLTVTEVNDPPVAVNDNVSTLEDVPVTIPVLLNDSDADNDPLTVTQAVAGNGIVTINANGTITYTPNANFNGVDIITYTISDGRGGFSTATVTVGVGIDNDAPVGTPIANQASVDSAPVSFPVAGNFSDVDGDTLNYSATGLPPGLSIDPATGLITGTITRTASQGNGGVYHVTIVVADGMGGQTTQSFDWTVTNPVPVAGNDLAATQEDTPVTIAPLTNDNDPDGDPLAVTAASAANGTVVVNPDGTITYTPNPNFNGTDTITYAISDGNGGTATAIITVTVGPVNDAPVAVNDNASTAEDTPVTVPVLTNDSDADGNPLTVTNAIAANGTVVINPDGTITYTPNANFNGVDVITYTISDGNGGTAIATVTMGVGLVNDAPVATPLASRANVDAAPVSVSVAGSFSDPDGDPLNFTATGLPAGLSISAGGIISGVIDPAASQTNGGVYTVTVTAADGNGGAVSQTFTWTVTNPAPVATNDTATTPEDQPVRIAVLANDTDPDGDPITVTAASAPNGTVVINPDGSITYTPNANFNGTDTITYTISDGNGGTSTARVTVTVSPVNDAPVAANDSATTNEDTPVTVVVLANDSDLDGDPLTVTGASASNGTVTINANGTVTYTPNPNFNGTDAIVYTISDGHGGTSTATVQITVNAVNDVPVATNDVAITPEDQPVTIAVLANDSDADGDPLTITSATSPNGTVVINPDGTVTFTPNPNFNGTAVITYVVSDGHGGTATATATVTVTPVNDLPVANNDVGSAIEDTPLVLSPLVNDSDVDGDPLTIIEASSPNGTVTINPNGTITFVPAADFNGPTTITYTISDGHGGLATATINVSVTPVNDPPVAVNDNVSVDEDTSVVIPVLVNDTDRDGDPLTVVQATAPNGTVAINADGTITYTPRPNYFGTDVITYRISDGHGGFSTATVTVTVNNINELPVDGDETLTTIGGVLNVIPVLANATDADGNILSVFTASVDFGTITINANGTITYVAPFGYTGPAQIIYVVSDGRGGFDRSVVTIDVVEAAADMNALIGEPINPGLNEGWRNDDIGDLSKANISVPLIVGDTVNDFRSLHGTTSLFGNRPLLNAINSISSLRGTPEHGTDGHAITETVGYLDRIRDLRFGHDRLFDPRWGDFMTKTLTGFSVRQLDTGNDQLMIESVVRDRVIYMEVRDIGTDADPRIVEYQLRARDGAPLPDWIRMDKRGLAIIERPVDAEEVHLIVRAIRADGKVFDIPVVVQGATGEIQLDKPLVGKKIAAADTLSKTLAVASAAANDEAAKLAAAFSIQA